MLEVKPFDPKNAIIEVLADIIERRDNTAEGHIPRTKKAMEIFAKAVMAEDKYKEQASSWNIERILLSCHLHDIGKAEIDDLILHKPNKLDNTEWEVIKRHCLLGGDLILKMQEIAGKSEFLDNAYAIAMYHHEKWDGTGYPNRLKGEEIPLLARLMAIVDVYDALVSERPYKKPFTHEEAKKIIDEAKGSSFDPDLTDIFLSVADQIEDIH